MRKGRNVPSNAALFLCNQSRDSHTCKFAIDGSFETVSMKHCLCPPIFINTFSSKTKKLPSTSEIKIKIYAFSLSFSSKLLIVFPLYFPLSRRVIKKKFFLPILFLLSDKKQMCCVKWCVPDAWWWVKRVFFFFILLFWDLIFCCFSILFVS